MAEQTAEKKVVQVPFEGKQERAHEVEFEIGKEAWSDYQLEDGTVIKMKNVVSRVLRLLDRTKEDGSPLFVIEGAAVVTTINPTGHSEAIKE